MTARGKITWSQAWVELLAEDPEALSALAVARLHLPAAARLEAIRRLRVFELAGPLPARVTQEELLHRSTQFYNPHKERCTVRTRRAEPAPLAAGEHVVLVSERGGDRCYAAERWWRHETGYAVEVREGIAWALRFEPGAPAAGCVAELATLRDRRHGLLCNPHAQEARIAAGEIPLPWMTPE